MTSRSVCLLAGIILLLGVAGAAAAPINYGDFDGTTVMYLDVTETAHSVDDTPPLYGAPGIFGNTLDFNPVGFSASSSDGGVDITDGNLAMRIHAHAGSYIEKLMFSEGGDFTMAGFGTDATVVDVTANFFIDVYEVDGLAIDVVSTNVSMTFSPNVEGTFRLETDGGGGPLFTGVWSGSLMLDVDALLDSAGIEYAFGATKAAINLDNTLVAVSEDGTQSLIAKKDFKGFSITVVPEPSTLLLGLLGAVGLLRMRRR